MAKRSRKRKGSSLASKVFVPIRVIGDTLVARVTNPSQKRAFKGLVSKIKRSLK